ncbi:MAG: 50S ribosomal protein L18 [Proteobacteria bacterium]|nr:50S ribosomal protein L18 [Pseudomonadota bacterium]
MNINIERRRKRVKRKKSIRRFITGTSERPRLSVFRTATNIYAQIIDDSTGNTLAAASTLSKELKGKVKKSGNVEAATKVGELISTLAKKKKVTKVAFDRNGFLYHGRVKALADAARDGGLEF